MKKIFIYFLILGTAAVSCKKEKALNVDLTKTNPVTYVPGEIDAWLTETFLNPYNMEILYRFNRFQAPIDKELTPVKEDQIRPALEAVRDIWINPYMEIAGAAFLKPIIPKQIALVGSAQHNMDGTITLGTAEAGRRVNLFKINDFSKTNLAGVEEMLHTVHHEFVHILHQNIPISPDFEKISPEYVGPSWVSFANTAAVGKALGYITRYSRSNKNEDFAETASTLLVEGQDYYDIYTNTAVAAAEVKLRKKEQAVVDYYKTNYAIDFRALQAKVKKAKSQITGVTRQFYTNLSAGAYKGLDVSKTAAAQPADFVAAYDLAQEDMLYYVGIPLSSTFSLDFTNLKVNRTDMILKFSGGGLDFWYNLKVAITPTGSVRFILAPAGTTAAYQYGSQVQDLIQPVLDYLTTQDFTAGWIESTIPNSTDKLGGFVSNSTKALAFYATIKR